MTETPRDLDHVEPCAVTAPMTGAAMVYRLQAAVYGKGRSTHDDRPPQYGFLKSKHLVLRLKVGALPWRSPNQAKGKGRAISPLPYGGP